MIRKTQNKHKQNTNMQKKKAKKLNTKLKMVLRHTVTHSIECIFLP